MSIPFVYEFPFESPSYNTKNYDVHKTYEFISDFQKVMKEYILPKFRGEFTPMFYFTIDFNRFGIGVELVLNEGGKPKHWLTLEFMFKYI